MSEELEKRIKHLEETEIKRDAELRTWLALRIADQRIDFHKSMLSQTKWLGVSNALVIVLLMLIAFK
ncbi:TPA: hypothetical protein ACWV5T_002375 [Salmonella enterica subsp. enterica serovar Muenchen]